MTSDKDQHPIAGLVITRSQCSCKDRKHYALENANDLNIMNDLGIKQPNINPRDLLSNHQPSHQLQDRMHSIEEPQAEGYATEKPPLGGNKKLIGIPSQDVGLDQESPNQHPPLHGPVQKQVQHRKTSDKDSGFVLTRSRKRKTSSSSSIYGVESRMNKKFNKMVSRSQDPPTHTKQKTERIVIDDETVVNAELFEFEKSLKDRGDLSTLAPEDPQRSSESMLDESLATSNSGDGVSSHVCFITDPAWHQKF